MNPRENLVVIETLLRKETQRLFRLWMQTILPSAVTTVLYFVIFGNVIGKRVGMMHGFSYIQFIAPGLIMMQVIMSSYNASVSAFFMSKFHRSIEEILVSPMSSFITLFSFVLVGVIRGMIIGLIVTIITLFFTHLHVYSYPLVILSALLSSCVFSLAGLINAVFAKTFDDISIIPTFVLTPLTYLGGVFYSISLLPPLWRKVSLINPIVYMVSTFRYGFFHMSDSHVQLSYLIMILIIFMLFLWAKYLFKRSSGLRS